MDSQFFSILLMKAKNGFLCFGNFFINIAYLNLFKVEKHFKELLAADGQDEVAQKLTELFKTV